MALQTQHHTHTLRGACACGRNRYVVEVPGPHVRHAELRIDDTLGSHLHTLSPNTLYLRVPLPWYTTATFAQRPDETRPLIQRSFASPFASDAARRTFCGYCGTPLAVWNERTREEAEFICVSVGSLLEEDIAVLEELGLVPGEEDSSDEEADSQVGSRPVASRELRSRGAPWFEEIVRNTPMGKLKQQRGGQSGNGVHVEWEVTEWVEGDSEAEQEQWRATPSKRVKLGDAEASEDAVMRSG